MRCLVASLHPLFATIWTAVLWMVAPVAFVLPLRLFVQTAACAPQTLVTSFQAVYSHLSPAMTQTHARLICAMPLQDASILQIQIAPTRAIHWIAMIAISALRIPAQVELALALL